MGAPNNKITAILNMVGSIISIGSKWFPIVTPKPKSAWCMQFGRHKKCTWWNAKCWKYNTRTSISMAIIIAAPKGSSTQLSNPKCCCCAMTNIEIYTSRMVKLKISVLIWVMRRLLGQRTVPEHCHTRRGTKIPHIAIAANAMIMLVTRA